MKKTIQFIFLLAINSISLNAMDNTLKNEVLIRNDIQEETRNLLNQLLQQTSLVSQNITDIQMSNLLIMYMQDRYANNNEIQELVQLWIENSSFAYDGTWLPSVVAVDSLQNLIKELFKNRNDLVFCTLIRLCLTVIKYNDLGLQKASSINADYSLSISMLIIFTYVDLLIEQRSSMQDVEQLGENFIFLVRECLATFYAFACIDNVLHVKDFSYVREEKVRDYFVGTVQASCMYRVLILASILINNFKSNKFKLNILNQQEVIPYEILFAHNSFLNQYFILSSMIAAYKERIGVQCAVNTNNFCTIVSLFVEAFILMKNSSWGESGAVITQARQLAEFLDADENLKLFSKKHPTSFEQQCYVTYDTQIQRLCRNAYSYVKIL